MHRVSVAALMGFILLVALGAAGLTSESELWCSALYSLSLVALTFAAVVAIVRRGVDRAFWLGFALFGGSYNYLAYDHAADPFGWFGAQRYSVGVTSAPRPRIVTDLLLDFLQRHTTRSAGPSVGANVQVQWGSPSSYYPAQVTKIESAQIQILWQGYRKGMEEWVLPSRVKLSGPVYFHATGHAVLTLIMALLGGLLCRAAVARKSGELGATSREPRAAEAAGAKNPTSL